MFSGQRAMGCVPCEVLPGTGARHVDSGSELPLLAGALWAEERGPGAMTVHAGGGGDSSGGEFADLHSADATVRQLRAQLAQLQQVSRHRASPVRGSGGGVLCALTRRHTW